MLKPRPWLFILNTLPQRSQWGSTTRRYLAPTGGRLYYRGILRAYHVLPRRLYTRLTGGHIPTDE